MRESDSQQRNVQRPLAAYPAPKIVDRSFFSAISTESGFIYDTGDINASCGTSPILGEAQLTTPISDVTIRDVREAQSVIAEHVSAAPLSPNALAKELGLAANRRVWLKECGATRLTREIAEKK